MDHLGVIPVLGKLQRLVLDNMELTHGLPAPVAQSLTNLTELKLSFSYIPAEISYMTSLRILHVNCEGALKLEMKIVDTVAALPLLRTLDLQSGSGVGEFGRLKESVHVLMALSRRFPSLELLL